MIIDTVRSWRGKNIVVVGDVCIDQWTYCTAHRMSPESPVPVLLHDRDVLQPGMAGLVCDMVKALGGVGHLIATDASRSALKTRIMARVPGRSYQPVCRVDYEDVVPLRREEEDSIVTSVTERLSSGDCDAVLLCDYSKGTCTPSLCSSLSRLCGDHGISIAVDPGRGADWENYSGMIVKANEQEFLSSRYDLDDLYSIGIRSLIVTCGDHGTDLVVCNDDGHVVTPIPVDPVEGVDVTGCGDQFHAVLGLCLASGVPLKDACVVANRAAGLQVKKAGCQPVTADELVGSL